MMTIHFNNKPLQIPSGSTLMDLINLHVDAAQCYSIALNRCFVPRARYAAVILGEFDEVDVIQPMQGG